MKTIVILGAGGFLAQAIAEHYQRLGWRIVAVGRSPADTPAHVRHAWNMPHPDFAHMLAVEQPTLCVNAAGRASVAASLDEPLVDFEAATVLNYRLLEDLRRRSPGTAYIHLSSAAVYGEPANLPVREDTPAAPISPYGWHKYLSEIVLVEHARQFGMRTASLRIFSAYGPALHRQVVWDLALRALQNGNDPLLLHGCREDSRDFIHGADVARAVELVASAGALEGECYNVATGVETPITEVARMVIEATGQARGIDFDARRRPGDPSRWHADISRLKALGFRAEIPLPTGVAAVVASARGEVGSG